MPDERTAKVEVSMYRKHDSIVGMRHHKPVVKAVLGRIRALKVRLDELPLGEYAKIVVMRGCDDLLHPDLVPDCDPRFRLQEYVAQEIDRLRDEYLPRYLFYRYRYEMYPQRRVLDEFPPCLQIEPTSICNYRCVFCYQADTSFSKKGAGHMGMMSLDTFKRAIDQATSRCEAVTLASRGEPLICPDIEEMLRYAAGRFLALKVNTNAWYLDEAKCHALLEADVSTLVFSADAASEPTYSQLRVGGKLDRVVRNIERFQDIRSKCYPGTRTITRVSGVRVPGVPGLDEMERFWGELVDQVVFVQYNPWENTYEQPLNDITTACSDLWRRTFVWWDGLVNPCDVDYKSTLAIGDVRNADIGSLWRSDAYEELRARHQSGQRGLCAPCNRCTVV